MKKKKMKIHPLVVLGFVLLLLIGSGIIKQPFAFYSLGSAFTITADKWESDGFRRIEYITLPPGTCMPETGGCSGLDSPTCYWVFDGTYKPYWQPWVDGMWMEFTECNAEVRVYRNGGLQTTTNEDCQFVSATQIRIMAPSYDGKALEGDTFEWTAHVVATRPTVATTTTTTTTQPSPPPPIDITTLKEILNNLWNSVMTWLRNLFSWLT